MTEKMKPSGIAWIGDIPQDWKCKRYRFCGNVQYGYPFNSDYFSSEETGFPLIRIRDITSGEIATYYEGTYPSEYVVQSGDVLIGMDGDFNVRIWKNRDALLNQRCCRVFDSQQISKRFMAYYLPHYLKVINDLTWSTTVKHLLADDINNIYVSYPGMREQQAIADFLDTQCAKIDSVIADIEKQIETLQKYKKSLIIETITNRKANWKYGRIKDLMTLQRGHDLPQEEFVSGNVPVYGSNGVIGYHNIPTTAGPCVTIGRSGSVGALNYVNCDFWAHNTAIFIANSKGNHIRYLYYVLQSFDIKELANGSAVPTLDRKKVEGMHLYFTLDPIEQREIANYLDARIAKFNQIIDVKQLQLDTIRQHKKSLIYEYVTGKKRVTKVN